MAFFKTQHDQGTALFHFPISFPIGIKKMPKKTHLYEKNTTKKKDCKEHIKTHKKTQKKPDKKLCVKEAIGRQTLFYRHLCLLCHGLNTDCLEGMKKPC